MHISWIITRDGVLLKPKNNRNKNLSWYFQMKLGLGVQVK